MQRNVFKSILKIFAVLVFLGVVLVIALVAYISVSHRQPLALPAPTGPDPVGRAAFDWTDTSRPDPLADAANQKRELAVWVWYPAAPAPAAQPAPYLPPAWAKASAADNGLGIYLEHDYALIQTHSVLDAPLSPSQPAYPVLILQPGMGPAIPDYTVFAENLASHGYIVVGVNETETQFTTVFPDGHVILRSSKGAIPDSASAAEAAQDLNRIGKVWADDALFVLDRLGALDQDPASPFFHRLDLARAGFFGHSFGGATALAVCQSDPRCKAGADLDGTPLSGAASRPVSVPFLFMSEGYPQKFPQGCEADPNCQALLAAYQSARNQAYFVTVNGAGHFNFTDRPYRSTPPARLLLKQIGITGPIAPERGLEITNAYLLAFFDHALKGEDSPLLAGDSAKYPEAQVESR